MKDNILSICLGNDFYNLNGSKNDAILFYNYLNLLYSFLKIQLHILSRHIYIYAFYLLL